MSDGVPARYHRQELVLGSDGQRVLGAAHAVIVGLGALGCTVADLLARAGVGTLTLIDRDVVEETNLQRQTLYDEHDARQGLPKAQAAAARLARVNSTIQLRPLAADLTPSSASALCGLDVAQAQRPGVIIDATDNFATRYLLNDLCVREARRGGHGPALVYGGVIATRGVQATFLAGPTDPCLRCVFEAPPAPGASETCDTAGVLGPVVAIVGAAQAMDALKVLSGNSGALSRSLLSFDAWANQRSRLSLRDTKREDCPACGLGRLDFLEGRDAGGEREAATFCGQDAVQAWAGAGLAGPLDLAALSERWREAQAGRCEHSVFMARLWPREAPGVRLSVFTDARVIVQGVRDAARARALVARFVG